jgi:predicted DNA-binding protein
MGTVSIRISEEIHDRLRTLSQHEGRPISKIAEDAVREYEKELRWRKAEAAMERLKSNPAEWEDYHREAAEWDAALGDGLERDPYEQDR